MSQHDMDVANQAGAAFRADINAAIAALVSLSSGATAPTTTFAYMLWADTSGGLLKIRNAANSAWITVGTLGSANLGLALAGAISASGLTGHREQGAETIFVPAGAMTARTTSGAAAGSGVETTTNKIMLKSMDFADGASKLYAQFAVRMPKSWNAGTVTAEFAWTANSTSTNSVVWGIQGVSLGNDETIDAAFGTAQEVTDANTATAYQVHLSGATAAVTIAGAGNSEWVVFQVYRDPTNGSDTLAATAMLLGVTLKYTTNAVNDA